MNMLRRHWPWLLVLVVLLAFVVRYRGELGAQRAPAARD